MLAWHVAFSKQSYASQAKCQEWIQQKYIAFPMLNDFLNHCLTLEILQISAQSTFDHFFFPLDKVLTNFRKLPNIVWDLSDSFRLDYWKWKTWQGWSRLTSLSLVFTDQTTVRIRTFVKCMSKRSKKLRKTFVKWYGTARRTLTLTTLCTSQHKRCSSVLLYQSCFKLL